MQFSSCPLVFFGGGISTFSSRDGFNSSLAAASYAFQHVYLAASVMLRPSNLYTPIVRSAACTSNRSCPLYPDDGQSFIESHKKSENLLKRQFGTLVSCGASLQSWAREACVNLSKKIWRQRSRVRRVSRNSTIANCTHYSMGGRSLEKC